MSQAFDEYAEEFTLLLQQLQCSSSTTNNTANDNNNHATTTGSIEPLLEQCQEMLQQMMIEARSCSDNVKDKRRCLERYNSYKEQYQAMKQELDRNALLHSSNDNTTTVPSSSIIDQKIQSNDSRMIQQSNVLEESMKSIHNTEQIANETMEQLHIQRATIQNTQKNTQTLSSLTQQAQTITTNLLKPWWKKGL